MLKPDGLALNVPVTPPVIVTLAVPTGQKLPPPAKLIVTSPGILFGLTLISEPTAEIWPEPPGKPAAPFPDPQSVTCARCPPKRIITSLAPALESVVPLRVIDFVTFGPPDVA